METLDSVLSGTGNPPIQRIATIDTRHDQKDAHQASAGTGTRRSGPSQGVCTGAATRGIFSHKARAEPAANFGFDVHVGQAAPRTIRRAQEIGAVRRTRQGAGGVAGPTAKRDSSTIPQARQREAKGARLKSEAAATRPTQNQRLGPLPSLPSSGQAE